MDERLKLLFINLQLRPDSKRRQLPVGLAYIMTAVKNAGYDFDFIDMDIDNLTIEDLEVELHKKIYDVYAFGCIVTGYSKVKRVAEIIRRIHPWAKIIVGNSVASSITNILLNTTEVNYAVLGEGDRTIVSLLKMLDDRFDKVHSVKGVAINNSHALLPPGYKTLSRKVIDDLDSIGFPDWELFDLEKYKVYGKVNVNEFSDREDIISFPLNSARGCPYNCGFCYHVFKGEKYRRYSINAVMEEVRRLYYRYGANYINFWDELTFPNTISARNFLYEFQKLPFKIGWAANTRAGVFNKKDIGLLRAMHTFGCTTLGASLESASPGILNSMSKGIKVPDFVEHVEVVYESGITPSTSVIFGYPQETGETIKLTLDVCERVGIFPSSGFLLPMPGTDIYNWAKGRGHIEDEVKYLESIGDRQDLHINLTQMEDKELYETVKGGLEKLAGKLGMKVDSVFKTVKRQKPKGK